MGGYASPGYNENTPTNAQAPPTSLPQNLYPQQDAGNPTDSNTPAVYSPTVGTYGSGSTPTGYTGYSSNPPGGNPPSNGLNYNSLAGVGVQALNTANQAEQAAQGLSSAGAENLGTYQSILNAELSKDPSARMAVQAPNIQANEQQTQSALTSLSSLPRGGDQDYLKGEAYIQEASDIGSLLDQVWNSAVQQEGALGTSETQLASQELQLAQNGLATGSSIYGGALKVKNGIAAGNQATVSNDMGELAMLAAAAYS